MAAELRAGGGRALGCAVPRRALAATSSALVDTAYGTFERVDVLVNCAGVSPLYPSLAACSEELFDKVVAVNLKGPFRLSALVGERMAAGDGGSIINVSSTGAVRPSGDIVPYAAAKAGLNAMTIGFADALGPNVRVNAIMPGPFLTTISETWDKEALAARTRTFALRRGGPRRGDRRCRAVSRERRVELHDGLDPHRGRRRTVEHAGRGRVMSAGRPLWLHAVLRLERAIGGPIEAAVHSDAYFDVVAQANRARARAIGAVEGVSRRGLHLLNLPAGTDIRRVREQLSRMERRMDALTDELAALEHARDGVAGEPGMAPPLQSADLVARVNRDVERSLLRARNGVALRARDASPEARRDAEGRRLARDKARAVALPRRPACATRRRS